MYILQLILVLLVILLLVHVIMTGTIRSGWQGTISIDTDQVKAYGHPYGEDAPAAQTVFYTPAWPIVDSGNVVTDDETDVTVYVNDVALLSTDFTLDGSEGKFTLDTGTTLHDTVTITYSALQTVGYCKKVTTEYDPQIKVEHVIGQYGPYAIYPSGLKISLKATMLYIDLRELHRATGRNYSGDLPDFIVTLTTHSGGEVMTLGGVKWGKIKFDMESGKAHGYDVSGLGMTLTTA